jgi:flagella basal body P-ring formation protein FlgA
VVAAPSAANPVKTITVSGLIEKTTLVPALSSAVKVGEIIGSGDIQWINVASKNMLNDTIVDADQLLGKTPSRSIEANAPIRARDVVAPQMVARGDEILLQFVTGGLQLTAKGKAMQNGAEGEFIRVMNLSSNQSLRGEVTGNKIVRVQ